MASPLMAGVYTAIEISAGEKICSADFRGKELGDTLGSHRAKPLSSVLLWMAVRQTQHLSV